jgi:hypothetical protein
MDANDPGCTVVHRALKLTEGRDAAATFRSWAMGDGRRAPGVGLPLEFVLRSMVGRARFELATNGLKVRCSTG